VGDDHSVSQHFVEQLDALALRHQGRRTPALSYAVATTRGLAAQGAVGRADLEHRTPAQTADQFPWFSMTKIATATAVVRLAGEGRLNLDAPLTDYLTAYRPGRYAAPTPRQLLSHTAGLRNPLPVRWVRPEYEPPNAGLIDTLVNKYGRPRRPPGQRGAYSNIGYLLLGKILESVTGHSAERAITDNVLHPLGMADTGFDYDPARPRATGYVRMPGIVQPLLRWFLPAGVVAGRVDGYTALLPFLVEGAAYGGLIGPAADAAKLARAHLTGPTDPASPGDLSGMREITHTGRPFDHGLGWFRRPVDATRTPAFVEHYGTGGGFWNAMRIYPTAGVAVVGMTNNTSTWPFDAFFTDVVALLGEHGQLAANGH
jgi:CubicO group peptidase (beta-lactamase class C family)